MPDIEKDVQEMIDLLKGSTIHGPYEVHTPERSVAVGVDGTVRDIDTERAGCPVCGRDEPGLSHASCNRAIELGVD